MLALGPSALLLMERVSPSYVGRGGFASIMRLNIAIAGVAAFIIPYQRSLCTLFILPIATEILITSLDRFYGVTENEREQKMDMREMVDKVKRGEPLYGVSELSEYMQGVSARNSRYSGAFLYMLPMFNFVNHNQVRWSFH